MNRNSTMRRGWAVVLAATSLWLGGAPAGGAERPPRPIAEGHATSVKVNVAAYCRVEGGKSGCPEAVPVEGTRREVPVHPASRIVLRFRVAVETVDPYLGPPGRCGRARGVRRVAGTHGRRWSFRVSRPTGLGERPCRLIDASADYAGRFDDRRVFFGFTTRPHDHVHAEARAEPQERPRCGGLTATILGTDSGERIRGTAGRDVIVGNGGGDRIRSGGGRDVVCGGPGADRISAGRGADRVRGNAGFDLLRGRAGADSLSGDGGDDGLEGGGGDDHLSGGMHPDVMSGDQGVDVCDGGPSGRRGGGDLAHRSCESIESARQFSGAID